MIKSDIFIADAHIKSKDDPLAGKLIRFFEHIKNTTRTLFILGDLFDFFFGENQASFSLYQPILNKLKELKENGVKIVYFEGNHDIFMGSFFTDTLNALVFPDDAKLEVDSKTFYITHGDMINYKDKGYLLWRRILRSRILFAVMKAMPPNALLSISGYLSKRSRGKTAGKKAIDAGLVENFATDKYKDGAYAVIFAHTHLPLLKETDGNFMVNPGAFCDNGSYAICNEGGFSLMNFNGTVAK